MENREKGVETTELWVERLRMAAAEHYSKHHESNDLLIQQKTANYVKHSIQVASAVSTTNINGYNNHQNQQHQETHTSPVVVVTKTEPMVSCVYIECPIKFPGCQRPYAMLKAPVPSITVVKQH
jgi:hypothetical protein